MYVVTISVYIIIRDSVTLCSSYHVGSECSFKNEFITLNYVFWSVVQLYSNYWVGKECSFHNESNNLNNVFGIGRTDEMIDRNTFRILFDTRFVLQNMYLIEYPLYVSK